MLFQLGPISFEVTPFNVDEYDRSYGSDFAVKEIVGAQKPREFVGASDETISFHGVLFPYRLGGLDEADILYQMANSGEPQILIRGDGANMGWFFVSKVDLKSQKLSGIGIGKTITMTISLIRSPNAASDDSIVNLLVNLLG